LCAKAKQPVRQDILTALDMQDSGIMVGAVCVYHDMIEHAVHHLRGSNIPVAAVSTGFPAGLSPLELRIAEIEASVAAGAEEIDIVISRRHVLQGKWQELYDELKAFRKACGPAHMKSILGSDFIKTSTGKEPVNATLPVSLVMVRAIRQYLEATGYKVGFKPAGGIRTAKDAINWLVLMKEELGREWLEPTLFRYGASSLLTDIERQLEHYVTGRYSAGYRHPMG